MLSHPVALSGSYLGLMQPNITFRLQTQQLKSRCGLNLQSTGVRCWHYGKIAPSVKDGRCKLQCSASGPTPPAGGPGFNEKGSMTLAHPDFKVIQDMWHPTHNKGAQPGDYTRGSNKKVSLRCLGCEHGCGRHHEWEAAVQDLTRKGGNDVCPFCTNKGRRFCPCQAVAADPRLSKEWHPTNPPAELVTRTSIQKHLWICPVAGHPDYKATCYSRAVNNSACPLCFAERRGKTQHPPLSKGRPDLASEWDQDRNDKTSSEVSLGSNYVAWWKCSSDPRHPPWQAKVARRALEGGGCPECAVQKRFGSD